MLTQALVYYLIVFRLFIAWGYLLFGKATSGFFFIVIYDSK
jgi:hypothetical protein